MSRDLVIPINFVQIFYTLQASHRSQITSLCRRLCSWALQPIDFSSRIGLFGPHYLSHFANGLLWSISFPSHFRLLAHALSLSIWSEFLAHVLSLLMCWVLHLVALIYKAISGNKLKPIVLLCQTGQWIIKHLRPRYFMQA